LKHDLQFARLTISPELDSRRLPGRQLTDQLRNGLGRRCAAAVNAQNDVPGLQPGQLRRAAFRNAPNSHSRSASFH
jgi:hypothetical protein